MGTTPNCNDARAPNPLAPRESEVLRLIADGKTIAEIAKEMGFTWYTARNHGSSALTKLGVDTREQAGSWWQGQPREAPARQPRRRNWGAALANALGMRMALVTLGLCAVVAAVVGVAVLAACAPPGDEPQQAESAEGEGTTTPANLADATTPTGAAGPGSDYYLPGELSESSVDVAQSFRDFPVMWLGKQFEGFNLTRMTINRQEVPEDLANIEPFTTGDHIELMYGSCELHGEGESRSCTLPMVVMLNVSAPIADPARAVELVAESTPYDVRGTSAGDIDRDRTVLPLPSGVDLTLHGNEVLRSAALQQLQTANHEALGIPPLTPADSLTHLAWPPSGE